MIHKESQSLAHEERVSN